MRQHIKDFSLCRQRFICLTAPVVASGASALDPVRRMRRNRCDFALALLLVFAQQGERCCIS